MPRSENSKIGALASLLIATMFSERLHADLVLDRAGDPGGEVELRRDGLAGLPDLAGIGEPAGVDDRARGRDRAAAAERLRQLVAQLEALGAAEPATARDEHVGALDVDVLAALLAAGDHPRARREVRERDLDLLDRGRPAGARRSKAFRRPMMIPTALRN